VFEEKLGRESGRQRFFTTSVDNFPPVDDRRAARARGG